jgi:aminoglycoside phosphotransferase (APT) family kinase protein
MGARSAWRRHAPTPRTTPQPASWPAAAKAMRVVDLLGVIHQLTGGWPQRSGFASSRQLFTSDRGGDVHLDAMPHHAVEAIPGAWQPILQGPECAIHADVGAGNILVDDDAVAMLDWDEARVDVPWFDYASLPIQVQVPSPTDRERLITAGLAWEAATCWVVEPAYAARCLAELFQRLGHLPTLNPDRVVSFPCTVYLLLTSHSVRGS